MNEKELTKILEDHKKWLNGDCGEKADLSNASLSNADLSNAYLRYADLSNANLNNATLSKKVIVLKACRWLFVYNEYNEKPLKIGCKENTINGWKEWFNSDKEFETKRGTKGFMLIESAFNHLLLMIKGE
jgi:hypothetical protein